MPTTRLKPSIISRSLRLSSRAFSLTKGTLFDDDPILSLDPIARAASTVRSRANPCQGKHCIVFDRLTRIHHGRNGRCRLHCVRREAQEPRKKRWNDIIVASMMVVLASGEGRPWRSTLRCPECICDRVYFLLSCLPFYTGLQRPTEHLLKVKMLSEDIEVWSHGRRTGMR